MIFSKTPFRISFVGGGTDNLKKQNFKGQVISCTINKFIFVGMNKKFDDKIRFSYSKTENVNHSKNLKHEMLRETFKYFNITKGFEVVSIGDIPSTGSGLGSSSSFLVGLIKCINSIKNLKLTRKKIAEIACHIEINILKKPIGMQDQYSAAFGGLNHIIFDKKNVKVNKIKISKYRLKIFESNLFLFYTNILRKSKSILKNVKKNNNIKFLKQIADLSSKFKKTLTSGDLDNIGKILNEGWELKKKLSKNTSNSILDKMYDYALKSGASGGKLLGAGGGGFFLFYVPKKNHKLFKKKMRKYKLVNFNFSKIENKNFNLA